MLPGQGAGFLDGNDADLGAVRPDEANRTETDLTVGANLGFAGARTWVKCDRGPPSERVKQKKAPGAGTAPEAPRQESNVQEHSPLIITDAPRPGNFFSQKDMRPPAPRGNRSGAADQDVPEEDGASAGGTGKKP